MEKPPGDLGIHLLKIATWVCVVLVFCALYLLTHSQRHLPVKTSVPSTNAANDAIRQAHAARSKAIEEATQIRYVPSPEDADGDFWTDAAELEAHTDPHNPERHPPYSFTIDGDQNAATSIELHLHWPIGLTADDVVVSEEMSMITSVTNEFQSEFCYSLHDTNDGWHTVFAKLLRKNGGISPGFGHTIILARGRPSLTITQPATSIVTGKRRWTLRGTASQGDDPHAWLQVTVNGDFVNDHSQTEWRSDNNLLTPGRNVFTVVARNAASVCVTSSVTLVYDPSLSTRQPTMSVDIPDHVVVGRRTGELMLWGACDDDDVRIQVKVFDIRNDTEPTATAEADVHDGFWWTPIQLPNKNNLVQVIAKNPASTAAQRQFRVDRDPRVDLIITKPAGGAVNAPSFHVTGVGSLNLRSATIKINGQVAAMTITPTNIEFRTRQPLKTLIGINPINITAERPGQLPLIAQ